MGNVDPGKFSHLPNNLKNLVMKIGFPTFQDMDDEEGEVFQRVKDGYCMTCGGVLGRTANFIITRHGIVAGYCGGPCHSDMAVMGFLQESHDDITQAVAFRAKGEPQHDPVPDTIGDDPAMDDHEGEDEA